MEYEVVETIASDTHIARLAGDAISFWSGSLIEAGDVAVRITDGTETLWCTVGDIQPMTAIIADASKQDKTLGPIASVEVVQNTKPFQYDCATCGRAINGGDVGLLFFQPPSTDASAAQLAIHNSCRDVFIQRVRSVWQYTELLLSEQL